MKLSSPWVFFYRELEALFNEDPEVKVIFSEDGPEVKLYVDNARKADALQQLLPEEKAFGNVTLKITIVPANDGKMTQAQAFGEAFLGNPALAGMYHIETPMGSFDYAAFKAKVVQFFNDDLSDLNGNCSTLYQEIAKDVFGMKADLLFCTEACDDKFAKPLGEWP